MANRTARKDTPREPGGVASAASPLQAAALSSTLAWYRTMVIARRFEEETERAFRRGKIGGYLHVYSGQEAVAAGFLAELRDDDIFFTAYRDHTHAIFRGAAPGAVMAELYGKSTGLARGKGGSMHMFDVSRGFYGGYGIVGGHIPLAVGAAYALRYHGTDRVCLVFLGDGAMNTGVFHESFNLAGLWGKEGLCPLVIVVENNEYGMGTSVARASAVIDLASRFSGYAIPNERVDGMDFMTVREAAARAIAQARSTGHPMAIEAHTYRFAGHGAADVFQPYRSKNEIEDARARDPVVILEQRLRGTGLLDETRVAAIHEEAEHIVADAVRFAEESPPPPPEDLYADVYGDEG
jgi:pyruvate dehydrogenase E1 component alpha subunit